eukprot:scaffold153005_cov32-Tisochrysis_lutea.AAC.2
MVEYFQRSAAVSRLRTYNGCVTRGISSGRRGCVQLTVVWWAVRSPSLWLPQRERGRLAARATSPYRSGRSHKWSPTRHLRLRRRGFGHPARAPPRRVPRAGHHSTTSRRPTWSIEGRGRPVRVVGNA